MSTCKLSAFNFCRFRDAMAKFLDHYMRPEEPVDPLNVSTV